MKNQTAVRQRRARTFTRLLPLAGVGYAALTIAGDLTIGEFPDGSASPAQLSQFYAQHGGAVRAGGHLMILGAYCLALFGVAVWTRVRDSGGPPVVAGLMLASTAIGVASELGGAGHYLLLGSIGADPTLTPAALQSVQVGLDHGEGGGALLLVALFAAGVFGRAIPSWLAWSALALGIGTLTQFGFFAAMVFLLWAAVAGVVLSLRAVGQLTTSSPGPARPALA